MKNPPFRSTIRPQLGAAPLPGGGLVTLGTMF
jgi:hypothetical protein